MTWQSVGTHTFVPTDKAVQVGSFDLAAGQDTIWVKITQLNPVDDWPWSYGILSWRNANGTPLGSLKAYSNRLGEVFRLGNGLPPSDGTGSIWFEPRGFNLGWLKAGFPWELQFEAQAGTSGGQVTSFWNRDPVNGTLSPAAAGDDVLLGSGFLTANSADINNGEIKLESNGFLTADRGSFYSGEAPSTSNAFSGVYVNAFAGGRSGWVNIYKGGLRVYDNDGLTTTPSIVMDADGSAVFQGHVTASNITFRSSDPNLRSGDQYLGPELDLLQEIVRLESLVKHLYEQLRLTPPSGWDVWDGSPDAVESLGKKPPKKP